MDAASSKKAEATTASAKRRGSKKPKAVDQPKAARLKREKVEKPVVFAFRLSEADRTKIHNAAGSAKASRFVLAAALAAADGDVEAFKKVIESRATK